MYRIMLSGLLLTIASTCMAQFTYAPVDFPGAVASVARGINNSGEVVGFYQTALCSNYDLNVPDCPTEGFKLVNNGYTTVMVSNSTATAVNGVNDFGDMVGFYTKTDGTRHGFIWFHTNVVETIDDPTTKFSTIPLGINNAGIIVGGDWSIGTNGTFSEGGWVWRNGTFSALNPGGSTNGTCCQSANGISNNNMFTGQVFYHDFWQSWFKAGKDLDFWQFQVGDTFGSALDTSADVTGYSSGNGAWFAPHIELNEGTGDKESISFKVVSYPGSQSTQPFGMNDSRNLAGSYFDSAGNRHGFTAQPTF
jgi:hypothetical protein